MVFRGNRRVFASAVDHLARFSPDHAKYASVLAQIALVVDVLMNLLMLGLSIWTFNTDSTTTSSTETTAPVYWGAQLQTTTTTAPSTDVCTDGFWGDGDHQGLGVAYAIQASGFLVAAAAEYYFDFLAIFQQSEPESAKTFDVNFSLIILSGVVSSQAFAETDRLPLGVGSVLDEIVKVQACLFFSEVFLAILDLNPISAFPTLGVSLWALQYDLNYCNNAGVNVVFVLWLFACFNAICIDQRRYQPGFVLLEIRLPFECLGILVANFFLIVWALIACGFWLFGYTKILDSTKASVTKLYSRNSIIKRASLIETKDHIFVSTTKSTFRAAWACALRCWSAMASAHGDEASKSGDEEDPQDGGEASEGGDEEEERAGGGDAEAPAAPGEEEDRRPRATEDEEGEKERAGEGHAEAPAGPAQEEARPPHATEDAPAAGGMPHLLQRWSWWPQKPVASAGAAEVPQRSERAQPPDAAPPCFSI